MSLACNRLRAHLLDIGPRVITIDPKTPVGSKWLLPNVRCPQISSGNHQNPKTFRYLCYLINKFNKINSTISTSATKQRSLLYKQVQLIHPTFFSGSHETTRFPQGLPWLIVIMAAVFLSARALTASRSASQPNFKIGKCTTSFIIRNNLGEA